MSKTPLWLFSDFIKLFIFSKTPLRLFSELIKLCNFVIALDTESLYNVTNLCLASYKLGMNKLWVTA